MLKRRYNPETKLITRDADDLTLTNPVDGIYNQPLFDLCADNALISLSLLGQYNRIIDVVGTLNSDVHRIVEHFITYVSADGTAAGTPTTGILAEPCEPGNQIESGGCSFLLEGWTRFRRTSPTRDITDGHMKYCMTQPIYDIQNNMIDDDYEWDAIRMMSTMIHDFQRWFINGNGANPGETDGLWNLIDFNYVDPVSGEPCLEMDSYVIDWDGNPLCPPDGAVGVTYNGNPIADGFTIIDIIKSYVTRVARRINMSSLSGAYNYVAMLPTELLSCLMSCYVCQVTCGGDITRMDEFEARAKLESLRNQLGGHDAVTMSFDGYNVTFFPYDYGMINPDGTMRMVIFVPTVGATPLFRIHMKDMGAAVSAIPSRHSSSEFTVTDNSRVLHWSVLDNTCYRQNVEMNSRLYFRAPWTAIKIDNLTCDEMFGNMSSDPLSPDFLGGATFTRHNRVVPPAIGG